MVRSFSLPLSNCYVEFEKEWFGWFEDRDDFTTWLANTYCVIPQGHESIKYVGFYIKDGKVQTTVCRHSGWTAVYEKFACKDAADLANVLYDIVGKPEFKIPTKIGPAKLWVRGETADGDEVEKDYDDFETARSVAGQIIENGGFAHLEDDDGNEYPIF